MEDIGYPTMHTTKRLIRRVVAYYFVFFSVLVSLWLALPSPLAMGDASLFGISSTTSFTRIYRTEDFPIGTGDDFFVVQFEVSPDERLVRIYQDSTPPIVLPLKHTENLVTNPTSQLNVTDWVGRLTDVRVSSHEDIVPSWISTGDKALLSWQLSQERQSVDLTAHYIEDKRKLASFELTASSNLSASLLSVHWNDNCAHPMFAVQFPPDPLSYPTSASYRLRAVILSILWPMNLALSYAFSYTLVFFEAIFGLYGIHIAIVFWAFMLIIIPLAMVLGWKRVISRLALTSTKSCSLKLEETGESRRVYPCFEKSPLVDVEAGEQQRI